MAGQPRILLVEDDSYYQEFYRRSLKDYSYQVTSTRRLSTALALIEEDPFDVIVTDLKMLGDSKDFSGFSVLEQAKQSNPNVQVIVITGFGTADHAMRAMGGGAYDYITKDADIPKKLPLAVQSALEAQALRHKLLDSEPDDDVEVLSDRIIGNSTSMKTLFKQVTRAAENDVNLLIYGEGGTGRRLLAQTIHRQSKRKNNPFLVVDCGRLSESVLMSELLGYESGAFFGATESQKGKFERANGGTIFLDSIGDLDQTLQKRLLGAICDRIVERVGGVNPIPVNVRIIASTDKDLTNLTRTNHFNRRIFDALNEFSISVPPLRDRTDGDDIPALAAMFLNRHREERQVKFSSETVQFLHNYDYPGNVRELESIVKYALTTSKGTLIEPRHLSPEVRQNQLLGNDQSTSEEPKDPNSILRVCPLNMGECSKKEEIIRLYSPRRVFVNIPDSPDQATFEQAAKDTIEDYGLIPILPKDDMETPSLLCNTCKLIQSCKYGISDVSSNEPDIHYNMGLMHAVGLHNTILKDRRTTQPVQVQGLYLLEYTNTRSMSERLAKWIEVKVKEATTVVETGSSSQSVDYLKLRQTLIVSFDENELRDLCFDLEIDYESLEAIGKASKARELIKYLIRRQRLSEFIELCKQLRPKIVWYTTK